jgi:flagellar protein FliO/FliZ
MLALTVRLIASLAVVIGLMLLLARLAGHRMRGSNGSLVRVLHRQPLTRAAGVSVVTVGGRVLVLGTTEQQVSLLAELDPFEMGLDEDLTDPADQPTLTADILSLSPRDGTDAAPVVRTADPDHTAASIPARGGSHRAPRPVAHGSALSGSILAPETWRQAVAAVTGRAS